MKMDELEVRLQRDADTVRRNAEPGPSLHRQIMARIEDRSAAQQPSPARRWNPFRGQPRFAVLTAAAAATLVVAAVGIYASNRFNRTSAPAAALAFGKLPAPALKPPNELGGGGGTTPAVLPYYGPAVLSWAGPFPEPPGTVPVYRFTLPDRPADDAFAASLGAAATGGIPAGPGLRQYSGTGFTLVIGPRDRTGLPAFSLLPDTRRPNPRSLTNAQARATADALLKRFGLTPAWPSRVAISTFGGGDQLFYTVEYQRLFDQGAGQQAGLVDGSGDAAGLQVLIAANAPSVQAVGPFPAAEQSASYPLRDQASLVKAALSAPAEPFNPVPGSGPSPTVKLTQVNLVYVFTMGGGFGYFEPAYLFTGTFVQGGQEYQKRVLVPAISGSAIRP